LSEQILELAAEHAGREFVRRPEGAARIKLERGIRHQDECRADAAARQAVQRGGRGMDKATAHNRMIGLAATR